MKDGLISHQTKVWSNKASFCEDKMDYFQCLHLLNIKSGRGLPVILLEVTNESQSTTLKSLDLSRKAGNMQSPQSSSAI